MVMNEFDTEQRQNVVVGALGEHVTEEGEGYRVVCSGTQTI